MRNRSLKINIDHAISSEDRLRLSLSRRDSVIWEQGYEVRLLQILVPWTSSVLLRLLPASTSYPLIKRLPPFFKELVEMLMACFDL
jgi:hypothetical protein